jgi:Flp pilus assembly protein TadB
MKKHKVILKKKVEPAEQHKAVEPVKSVDSKKRFFGLFKKKNSNTVPVKSHDEIHTSTNIKKKKVRLKTYERKVRLKTAIERASLNVDVKKLNKTFFYAAVIINLLVSLYLIYYFSVTYGISWSTIIISMILLWVGVFVLLIVALNFVFYSFVDLQIFKRKMDMEEVLPDFLQLTASNINAGMPIDRALWFAVRPRFGVLAKEIETVAKETIGGADLKFALDKFASKYDSPILKRSVSMLNEGMDAGGEIGELLNRIVRDIEEQRSMLKEMSANLTTYVIFIGFATIVAAPFLYALSGVLIQVVQTIGSSLSDATTGAASAVIPISFGGASIAQTDFKIFAFASLSSTSFFSAMMIGAIKKGDPKQGLKYVPIFIFVSVALYFIAQFLVGGLVNVFF